MEPVLKRPKKTVRPKKKAKKAVIEEQPAAPAAQIIPAEGYLWTRDEEELLVDYKPAGKPASFLPMEDDISVVGEDLLPPADGQNKISSATNDFPADLAENGLMAGVKRSKFNLRGRASPQDQPQHLRRQPPAKR
jgi:hypothetical protein